MIRVSRILVLEDDLILRESLQDLLEDEGYEVALAGNSAQALALFQEVSPDLIVFDIRMEGPDGLETLSMLQASGTDIPSLAITGYAAESDSIRALKLGVGDYLKKPFRPEQLLHSVSRLLAKHHHETGLLQGVVDLRGTALWASGCREAGELSELVSVLCRSAGLTASQTAELEILAQLQRNSPSGLNWTECPERVQRWVECLPERYDGAGALGLRAGEIPVQARVLALALAAERGHSAEELIARDPGRFDPLLLETLGQLRPQAADLPRLQTKLAQTLALRGDQAGARALLEGLAAGEPSSWAVDATLTLARLHFAQPARVLDTLRAAVELSRQVGPVCQARCLYRSGLLLREMGAPQSETALLQAGQQLEAAGLRVEAALCQLLQGSAQAEQLELVLRPEHERQLVPVLPAIYAICRQSPEWERYARRCLNRYPFLEKQTAPSEGVRPSHLRVLTFGEVQVNWGDFAVEEGHWRGPLVKVLFAYLAASRRPVLEETLLDLFWPEHHDNSRRRFSGALSSLRRTLNPEGLALLDPILRQRDRYCLNPALEPSVDLLEFQQARDQARQAQRQGDMETALNHYRRMADLHQAPFLEGCYMDWALAVREEALSNLNEALLQLAESALVRRDFAAALEDSLRCLHWDELQPRAQNVVLRAYVGTGQPDRAVRHFQQHQQKLKRELDVEPSIELLEAYHLARLAVE